MQHWYFPLTSLFWTSEPPTASCTILPPILKFMNVVCSLTFDTAHGKTFVCLEVVLTSPIFTATQELALLMLQMAHKNAFLGIITHACSLVTASLCLLNGRAAGPNSLLTSLQLAESLQVDAFKASLGTAVQNCSADMWSLIAVDVGLAHLQVQFDHSHM